MPGSADVETEDIAAFLSTIEELIDFGDLEDVLSSSSAHVQVALESERNANVQAPCPKFVSSRARQQYQMAALRQELQALTETLHELQAGQRAPWPPNAAYPVEQGAHAKVTWRLAAAKELSRLDAARVDNKRLRLRALDQKKLLKRVRQMLSMRGATCANVSKKLQLAPPRPDLTIGLRMEDGAVFDMLLAKLGAMDIGVETQVGRLLLAEPRPPLANAATRRWNTRYDPTEFVGAEVITSKELPFGRSEVERAMQSLILRHGGQPESVMAQVHGGAPDTTIQKWVARVDIPDLSGTLCSHRVHRTLSREAHTVVLSTSVIAVANDRSCSATGVVLSHQMWMILTAIEDERAPQHEATLVRALSSISVSAADGPAGWEKAFVRKTMLPKWGEALTSGHQRLENELLDRRRVLVRAGDTA